MTTKDMTKERIAKLRPCPFCDGPAERAGEVTEYLIEWFFNRCSDCGATGSIESSEEEADAAWNRRAETRRGKK